MRPVFCRNFSVKPRAFSSSQYSLVRRHCQTMAWQMGSPVSLSQTMVVSRWLVMPMAAMSSAGRDFVHGREGHAQLGGQISLASCSTQPGLG